MKNIKKIALSFLFVSIMCMPLSLKAQIEADDDAGETTDWFSDNVDESSNNDVSFEGTTGDESYSNTNWVEEEKNKDKKKKKDKVKLHEGFYVNLGIDLLTMLIIVFLIYFPANKKRDYIFSYMLFNVVIYLLTFVLNDVKISMGAAFGLFAVFTMLRYRTAGISMKDMTYLFVFIALGLLSAISLKYLDLVIIHGIVLAFLFLLDGGIVFKRELSKSILYENIENIKPEKYNDLLEDLKARTGLNIHRVSIGKINFLRDAANVKIFYYERKKSNGSKNHD